MKFTVLGSSGFVGSNLIDYLSCSGINCYAPMRDDTAIFKNNLGHVVYCIGLTADFREKPFETVNAHVCYLAHILKNIKFDSFLYLSSTRIYRGTDSTNEDALIKTDPSNPDALYNISKLMGESLCLSSKLPNMRVARISNIFGNDFSSSNFLTSILREAIIDNKIISKTTLSSQKDYISIHDVVKLLPLISQKGEYKVYNVASGINVSNHELMNKISMATGCKVEVVPRADLVNYPQISIKRISAEFNFQALSILDSIDDLIIVYKKKLKK